MKTFLIVAVFVISACVAPAMAVDYTVDPTFNPTFTFPDFNVDSSIGDVYVQPDGKLLIGGTFSSVNGEPVKALVRLNPDGTPDTTFNSVLTQYTNVLPYVDRIRPLADGKFLVFGRFAANGEFTYYAKLNADGSLDNSMPIRTASGEDMVQTADGKFISCSGRWINEQTYWIAHRLNSDGSVDPTFRITFSQGTCQGIELQPDGKILISGGFHSPNNFYYKPIQRFNPDGSHDPTFDAEFIGQSPRGVKFKLADGKIFMSYESGSNTRYVQKFGINGNLETTFANCTGNAILPKADGTTLVSGCRKWPTGPQYQFANLRADGKIEPGLDRIEFNGAPIDFQNAGGGKYYAYGSFTSVNGVTRAKIVRLMPHSVPVKAKFDFDGDGKSDYTVFRPSDRYWYLYQSTTGFGYLNWGLSTDTPVAGHYDSDGKTDAAVFRDGAWYANGSSIGYNWLKLGIAGHRPFLGDFDGDKQQDWATRDTLNGSTIWHVLMDNVRIYGTYTSEAVAGEVASDIPLIGDFDGDSRDEIGYFRNGVWYSRDYLSGAPTESFQWGAAGDVPVHEDYDGDGQTDYAVFRPSTGVWWINRSTAGWLIVGFGISTDIPVPADYDGDGKTDIAIYRDGQWWQIFSSSRSVGVANWGSAGDIPIPAQAQR
jgi:uncharacterized delta-60 repeat protein